MPETALLWQITKTPPDARWGVLAGGVMVLLGDEAAFE